MGKYPWSEREEQRREWRRPVPKKKQPIKKVAEKRKGEDKVYFAMRDLFLKLWNACQIGAPGCTKLATDVHHKAGRIGNKYLDQAYWMASCRHCNLFVEENSQWAYDNGFKETKHQ